MRPRREKEFFPTIHSIPTKLPPPPPEIVVLKNESGQPIGKVELSMEDFFNKTWEALEPHERYLPEEPLDRCQLRWERLFLGIWWALDRYDPKITFAIAQALKKFGLADEDFPFALLFEKNPSDELLRRVSIFEKLGHIPNLRGKKRPETRYDPFFALHDYFIALSGLGNYRAQSYRNPSAALKTLRERIQEILPRMHFARTKEIPEARLKEWTDRRLHKKDLAVRLTAHLHGLSIAFFRKRLTEARQKHPGYAKLGEHGHDYTKEQPLHKPPPTLEELEMMKREIETVQQQKGDQIEGLSWIYDCLLKAIQRKKSGQE